MKTLFCMVYSLWCSVVTSDLLQVNKTNSTGHCISCQKVWYVHLKDPHHTLRWNKPSYHVYHVFDLKTQRLINRQQSCYKPTYDIQFSLSKEKNIGKKRERKKVLSYKQGSMFYQWFHSLNEYFMNLLPRRKAVCITCSKKLYFHTVSKKDSTLQTFKKLLFGSYIKQNSNMYMCFKAQTLLSRENGWYEKFITLGHANVSYQSLSILEQRNFTVSTGEIKSNGEWYYRFASVLKLQCNNSFSFNQTFLVPAADITDLPKRICFQKWRNKFIRSLKLTCKDKTRICYRDMFWNEWYRHFGSLLKLTCHNKKFTIKDKTDESHEKWWQHFVSLLKLKSKNRNLINFDGLYEKWGTHFVTSFKLQSMNRQRRGCRNITAVSSDMNISYSWWNLMSLFKLTCVNSNFKKIEVNNTANATYSSDAVENASVLVMSPSFNAEKTQLFFRNMWNYFRFTCVNVNHAKHKNDTRTLEKLQNKTFPSLLDVNRNGNISVNKNIELEKNLVASSLSNVTEKRSISTERIISNVEKRLLVIASRCLAGEVDDALLLYLVFCYLVLRSAVKKHMSFEVDEPKVNRSEQQVSLKPGVDTKTLEIPAAVIAARKKLELELIVAIVDVSSYPAYPSNMIAANSVKMKPTFQTYPVNASF